MAVALSETLSGSLEELVQSLVEEESYYIGEETGRQLRWGELEAQGMLQVQDVPAEFHVVDSLGLDIFGQPLAKKYKFKCECPRCHKTLDAAKFTPHLELCMGLNKRKSSRIASRLAITSTANSGSKQSQNGEIPSEEKQDETVERKRKSTKGKRIQRDNKAKNIDGVGIIGKQQQEEVSPSVTDSSVTDTSLEMKISHLHL